MIAINHACTGALIGLAVGNPLFALPASLVSHFVCDAIPHFGYKDSFMKTKGFKVYLGVDALLCVLLVAALAFFQPQHWILAAVCAFVAAAPDLLWVPLYMSILTGKQFVRNGFYAFASKIQWFERPIGGVVELVWLGGCAAILGNYL